jgi:hypothetical protein
MKRGRHPTANAGASAAEAVVSGSVAAAVANGGNSFLICKLRFISSQLQRNALVELRQGRERL